MPFGNAFGWPHLIVILAVVILLFGATRLPALSKSLGQSIKIFRKEMHDVKDDVDREQRSTARDRAEEQVVTTSEPPAGGAERRASSSYPGSTDR